MMTQKAMKVLEGIIIYNIMYFFPISLFIRDDISRHYIQMNSKLDSTIYITKLLFLLINIYQD